jgi:hypothetical protein
MRLWRAQSTVHPPLSHINKFGVTPQSLSPFYHRPSADYSQAHSDNFGNFLRVLN